MIDTHCHLDLEAFDADRAAAIERATSAGVLGVLIPAIRPATWPVVVELCRAIGPWARAALGVHPQIVPHLDADERALLRDPDAALATALTAAADVVVAVGECGLDGATADAAEQDRLLRAHLRVARALDLPVVLHVLGAHGRALELLQAEAASGPFRGVLHSYSGSPELVARYAELDLYLSFAGAITYPGARRPGAAARLVAADRLLAETDGPDQTPAPRRPGRNEPAFLPHVLAGLAQACGGGAAELAARTTRNARRLFGAWPEQLAVVPPWPGGEVHS